MVRVDDSHYPLVVTHWEGQISMADVDRYHAKMSEVVDRARDVGDRLVMISDGTHVKPMDAKVRSHVSEKLSKHSKYQGTTIVAHYAVIPNPLVRGVMTALGWVRREVEFVETVPSLDEALDRARAFFVKEGLPVEMVDAFRERVRAS